MYEIKLLRYLVGGYLLFFLCYLPAGKGYASSGRNNKMSSLIMKFKTFNVKQDIQRAYEIMRDTTIHPSLSHSFTLASTPPAPPQPFQNLAEFILTIILI